MRSRLMKVKSGDTLVEVAFAIAIFAAVSIIAINVMNAGMNTAQASLEVTMARNEMDAQAEAIRFIHNAFTLEREEVVEQQQYRSLWRRLTRDAADVFESGMANEAANLPELAVNSCSEIYDRGNKSILNPKLKAFIMNTRIIDPEDETFFTSGTADLNQIIVPTTTRNSDGSIVVSSNADKIFVETQLYPRVLFSKTASTNGAAGDENSDTELSEDGEYRNVARAEGIWIIAVKDETNNARGGINNTIQLMPEFFDFHIRTCWYAPGREQPTTIGTIIRLYNPEIVEETDR